MDGTRWLHRRWQVGTVMGLAASTSLVATTFSFWAAPASDSLAIPVASLAVVLGFVVVGSLVVSARPANPVGWLLVGGGVAWAVGNAAIAVAYRGLVVEPGSVHAVAAWALFGACVRDLGWWAVVIGLPIVYPSGHVASRRWRWLPVLAVVVPACAVLETLTAPDADLTQLDPWHNPLALPSGLHFINGLAFLGSVPLGLAVLIAAAVQLRERWHAGAPLERQQLLLFGLAAIPPAIAAPLALAGVAPGVIFYISVIPLPFAIGFAVLARGLYDLATATNRTLVWATLSLVVAAVYTVVVIGIGHVVDVAGAPWLPWVAAAVLAVSLAPLRQLVQRAVDRLTFGRWAEPYDVLAALGQQLAATGDVDLLLSQVVRQLSDLGLPGVAVSDVRGSVLAQSGSLEGPVVRLPLMAYDRPVGVLAYRTPVLELRPRDLRLLDDVAGHLGAVLHGHLLTVDLQQARERLVLAREEERRRLRRDLHDGLGPALAGHLLRLDVIAAKVGEGPGGADIDALRADLRATILEVRRVVEGLRPPALDNLGLEGALRQVTYRLAAGTVELDLRCADLPPLSAATEVAVLRIVTEAVSNAVRHAGGSVCRVRLDVDGELLRVTVSDDGRGLDGTDSGGHGMQTMRERAEELRGRLTVTTAPGVTVVAEIPLPRVSRAAVPALVGSAP